MPHYRHQVIEWPSSGLPRDKIVNSWHTEGPDDATAVGAVAQAIRDFYVTPVVGDASHSGKALSAYWTAEISRTANACQVLTYKMPGARGPTGSPIGTLNFTAAAKWGGWTDLPSEVAVVLSLAADLTGLFQQGAPEQIVTPARAVRMGAPATHLGRPRPKNRRRGRLFLGPLISAGVAGDLVGDTFRNDILYAAHRAAQSILAAVGVGHTGLEIWSNHDWAGYQAITATVDDAPDTVRKRGPKATTRFGSVGNLLAP